MPIFNTREAAAAFGLWRAILEKERGLSSLGDLEACLRRREVNVPQTQAAKAGGTVLKKNLFLGPASDDGRRERVALWGVEGKLCTSWCEYPAGFKLFVAKGEACVRRQGATIFNGFQGGVLEDLTSAGSLRCRIEVEVNPRRPCTVFLMHELNGFRPLAS